MDDKVHYVASALNNRARTACGLEGDKVPGDRFYTCVQQVLHRIRRFVAVHKRPAEVTCPTCLRRLAR